MKLCTNRGGRDTIPPWQSRKKPWLCGSRNTKPFPTRQRLKEIIPGPTLSGGIDSTEKPIRNRQHMKPTIKQWGKGTPTQSSPQRLTITKPQRSGSTKWDSTARHLSNLFRHLYRLAPSERDSAGQPNPLAPTKPNVGPSGNDLG